MNQTAGLFGGLLIVGAIVAAYVYDRATTAGSFAAAFPGVANWVNGGPPASTSSSAPPAASGTDVLSGEPSSSPTGILGSLAYQLALTPNGGLQFQNSPNSGVTTALPGPSTPQLATTSLASMLPYLQQNSVAV